MAEGEEVERVEEEEPFNPIDKRQYRVDEKRLVDLSPVELGGSDYEFKWEPRCRVCTAGDGILLLVNKSLVEGYTYSDIVRMVEPYNITLPHNKRLSYDSIRNHKLRHLPFESAAVREILERRAQRTQKDFIEGQQRVIDAHSYAEVMMTKGFEQLVKDTTVVTPEAGLEAALILSKLEKDESGQASLAEAMSQLSRIIQAVKKHVSPAQMELIVQEVQMLEGRVVTEVEE